MDQQWAFLGQIYVFSSTFFDVSWFNITISYHGRLLPNFSYLYLKVTNLLHTQQFTATATATATAATTDTDTINASRHENTIMLLIPMTQGCLLQHKQTINDNRLIFLIFIEE